MAAALPWVKPRYFDANGAPLAGGKVFTYLAGTTTPAASYTDSTGLVPNTNPYILDADGYGDIWLRPGSYKVVLKDANDVVIFTKDKVKPADGGGGGIVDSDYTYEGYSSRFSAFFGPTTGLADTLAKILIITYQAPSVTLSASGSGTIREKGTVVSATTLAATLTKRSDPISAVRFLKGVALVATQTTGGGIPLGGISTYNWTGSFSDNQSFMAQCDDSGATGGPTTAASSLSFTFVYPLYYGAGTTGKTGAQIRSDLTLDASQAASSKLVTFSATVGQRLYFAYPSSDSALVSILDVSGFETLPDWTQSTLSITGLDATAQTYRVYIFNNLVGVAGSFPYTFKR